MNINISELLARATSEAEVYHYGTKGMRWGVRKKAPAVAQEVAIKAAPGKRVKATGGKANPVAEDAIQAARLRQIAKRSTTDSLSNKDLQALITRMNLEEQYDRLSKSDVRLSRGQRLAKGLLKDLDPDSAASVVAIGAGKVAGKPVSPQVTAGIRLGAMIAKAAAGGKTQKKKEKKSEKEKATDPKPASNDE